MRWVILTLGLVGSAVILYSTVTVYSLATAAHHEDMVGASVMGVAMGIAWLIASAAVIAAPPASMVLFLIAGWIGHVYAEQYPDLGTFGRLSFILAIASLFAWVAKRRNEQRAAALAERRHQELLAAMRSGTPPVSGP